MRLELFLVFISLFFHVDGYFTLVGSRTFLFGSDYKVFVTSNHEKRKTSEIRLELKGEKYGELLEQSVALDRPEKLVVFDVSLP